MPMDKSRASTNKVDMTHTEKNSETLVNFASPRQFWQARTKYVLMVCFTLLKGKQVDTWRQIDVELTFMRSEYDVNFT